MIFNCYIQIILRNRLLELLAIGKLKKSNFSAKKWKEVFSALQSAKDALNRNYSVTESAVKGLEDAIKNLKIVLKIGKSKRYCKIYILPLNSFLKRL